MFQKIENAILLGVSVNFNKDNSGFKIEFCKDNKIEFVVLPYDHLTEHKICKYLDFMLNKILER